MKVHEDQKAHLDRGGRPTLGDLIDRLEFRPGTGSITLAGERLVLQRAAANAHLQQQIIKELGKDAAMALLMRVGFQAGREDASFVRKTWPNIDIGDAFTAGTRLHMVTGTVRVDTLANDFDFDKDRFRAEFEWHDSIEATEYVRKFGRGHYPVCWTQLGYASGYASEFFRKLVIYKEVQCAATGHKNCRLVGRTSDGWGDDPFARFFLEHVLLHRKFGAGSNPNRPVSRPGGARDDRGGPEDLRLRPIAAALKKIAAARTHALITGPTGSGQDRAALWLATQMGARKPTLVSCRHPEVSEAIATWQEQAQEVPLVLIGLEHLSADLQGDLAIRLNLGQSTAPVIATLNCPLSHGVASDGLAPGLVERLLTLPLDLPPLASRGNDIAELAQQILRGRTESAGYELTPEDRALLASQPWPGNAAQLEAVLIRAVFMCDAAEFEGRWIAEALAFVSDAGAGVPLGVRDVWQHLRRDFEAGRLTINDVTNDLYAAALEACDGNISGAARLLGITRAQFAYRISARADE